MRCELAGGVGITRVQNASVCVRVVEVNPIVKKKRLEKEAEIRWWSSRLYPKGKGK